jgi:hypothetical protein
LQNKIEIQLKKTTKTLIDASRDGDLKINVLKNSRQIVSKYDTIQKIWNDIKKQTNSMV